MTWTPWAFLYRSKAGLSTDLNTFSLSYEAKGFFLCMFNEPACGKKRGNAQEMVFKGGIIDPWMVLLHPCLCSGSLTHQMETVGAGLPLGDRFLLLLFCDLHDTVLKSLFFAEEPHSDKVSKVLRCIWLPSQAFNLMSLGGWWWVEAGFQITWWTPLLSLHPPADLVFEFGHRFLCRTCWTE